MFPGEKYKPPNLPEFIPEEKRTYMSTIKFLLEDPNDPDIKQPALPAAGHIKKHVKKRKEPSKRKAVLKKLQDESVEHLSIVTATGEVIYFTRDRDVSKIKPEAAVVLDSGSSSSDSENETPVVTVSDTDPDQEVDNADGDGDGNEPFPALRKAQGQLGIRPKSSVAKQCEHGGRNKAKRQENTKDNPSRKQVRSKKTAGSQLKTTNKRDEISSSEDEIKQTGSHGKMRKRKRDISSSQDENEQRPKTKKKPPPFNFSSTDKSDTEHDILSPAHKGEKDAAAKKDSTESHDVDAGHHGKTPPAPQRKTEAAANNPVVTSVEVHAAANNPVVTSVEVHAAPNILEDILPDGNIDHFNSPAHEEPLITHTIPADTDSTKEQADADDDEDIIFEGISQVSDETMKILKEKHEENKKKQKSELYEETKNCLKCEPFNLCEDHTYRLAMINMKTETGFGWPSLPKEEKTTAADRKRKAEEVQTGSDEGKKQGKPTAAERKADELHTGSEKGKKEGKLSGEKHAEGQEKKAGSDKEEDDEEEEEEGDNEDDNEKENNGHKSPPPPPPPAPPAPKPPLPPPQLDESRTNDPSGKTTTSTSTSTSSSQPDAGKAKTGKFHYYYLLKYICG